MIEIEEVFYKVWCPQCGEGDKNELTFDGGDWYCYNCKKILDEYKGEEKDEL